MWLSVRQILIIFNVTQSYQNNLFSADTILYCKANLIIDFVFEVHLIESLLKDVLINTGTVCRL